MPHRVESIEAIGRLWPEGGQARPRDSVIGGFEATPAWFVNFAESCLAPGDRLALRRVVGSQGDGVGFPFRLAAESWAGLPIRTLASLTNYYSCGFALPGLESSADAAAVVADWARDMRRAFRPHRVRVDALDRREPAFAAIAAGLAQAGYLVEPHFQFGNWYLPVAGLDFESYWAARPPALRHTVARRSRALQRGWRIEIDHYGCAEDTARAVAEYESVYERSWKRAEPHPGFMPGLIAAALDAGAATVSVLRADGEPVAAQLWLTHGRRATIFKLAHDEAWRQRSVGTVLTHACLDRAIAAGGLDEIDFGRGDDPYKAMWLPERRERWGILAYDPLLPVGLALALRNFGPKLVRRWLRRGPVARPGRDAGAPAAAGLDRS